MINMPRYTLPPKKKWKIANFGDKKKHVLNGPHFPLNRDYGRKSSYIYYNYNHILIELIHDLQSRQLFSVHSGIFESSSSPFPAEMTFSRLDPGSPFRSESIPSIAPCLGCGFHHADIS